MQAFLEDPVGAKAGRSKADFLRRANLPTDLPQASRLEDRIKEELLALGVIDSPKVRMYSTLLEEGEGRGMEGNVVFSLVA